jgi:hypothetical protein
MKKTLFVVLLAWTLAVSCCAQGQANVERENAAIREAVLNYIEGWYEANPARMEKALDAELVKRCVEKSPTGKSVLISIGARTMVDYTRAGGGSKTPKEKRQNEVVILDASGGIATAKALSADYIDYVHLAKIDGQWKIVNVLWKSRHPH